MSKKKTKKNYNGRTLDELTQKMKVVVEYNTSHILEINSGDNKKNSKKVF